MTMNLEFDGLDELIKEVDRIDGITQELKDQALIEGGEVLLKAMQNEVYTNLNRRSGEAIASLIRTEPKKNEVFVGTQGGKQQMGYYLYMHEFGYYNVKAKRFMPPLGFASRAYELSLNKILDAYVEVFRKGLDMK